MSEPAPDATETLTYTGTACRRDEHAACPAAWQDREYPGLRTRCACACHKGAEGRDA